LYDNLPQAVARNEGKEDRKSFFILLSILPHDGLGKEGNEEIDYSFFLPINDIPRDVVGKATEGRIALRKRHAFHPPLFSSQKRPEERL
jgi:hypothetical protein